MCAWRAHASACVFVFTLSHTSAARSLGQEVCSGVAAAPAGSAVTKYDGLAAQHVLAQGFHRHLPLIHDLGPQHIVPLGTLLYRENGY